MKLPGSPINILNVTEKNEFIVNSEEIDKIFDHDLLNDRRVVAVSIVGIFRKGKSFLLNYFLRYLYGSVSLTFLNLLYPLNKTYSQQFRSTKYPNNPLNDTQNWMRHKDEELKGFSWRAGTARDTNGIIMWSDVFLYDARNGDKLAIILIDTQGLFDQKTIAAVNSKLFSVTTLISSVQIYNLRDVIEEKELEYLQFTSDYAKLINDADLNDEHGLESAFLEKPFQNIVLLMRDWKSKRQYPYGLKGGNDYLKSVLKITKDHKKDGRQIREYINSAYENISCFLMPFPGSRMINSEDFAGEWGILDADFVTQLKELSSWLFHPSNLVPKRFFDNFVTAEDYAEHLKSYLHAVSSSELMNVTAIFDATMESEGNVMLQKIIKLLKHSLRNRENFEDLRFEEKLDDIAKESKNLATKEFAKLMENFGGNGNFATKWTAKVKDQISKEIKEWKISAFSSFKKYQNAKKQAQEEVSRTLEAQKTEFELKINQLKQKSLKEKNDIQAQFNSTIRSFQIEKIKIEQENEKQREKILHEKLKDLEAAKRRCEMLVNNTKNNYIEQMNDLKKNELKLQKEKERLEQETRDQEKQLKEIEAKTTEKFKSDIERMKKLHELQLEEAILKYTLSSVRRNS